VRNGVRVYVTGTRPMVRANTPGASRHELLLETEQAAHFVPRRVIERAWPPLAALSWPHPRGAPYDLIHGLNAIPITVKPFITTFESILPRALGPGGPAVALRLRDRLTRPNCRALVAMSQYARGKFIKANRGWPALDSTLAKVRVIYPHFDARPATVRQYSAGTPLRLIFVGNDFARKGGIVALRVVAKATALGLPVHLDVISAMRMAGDVYTDHPDKGRYAADLRGLVEPTVTMHGRVPNAEVLAVMAQAHVQLLPTLDDTFGNSVVEGFSVATPAIVSNVCAMPELVPPEAGAIVTIPVDAWGNWQGLGTREDRDYWDRLDAVYESLAKQVLAQLVGLADAPQQIAAWSEGALSRFRRVHESTTANATLDDLYDAALN
jgi:glycosyltransferase involved in cell wall biosynthesis